MPTHKNREGNGTPTPVLLPGMEGEAWKAAVHGVAKSWA